MCNIYLVLAYGLLWTVFAVYSWVIHQRQGRLERELDELKSTLDRR